MKYVLDSNILIHYARKSAVWEYVKTHYFPKRLKGNIFISFATKAEVLSFSNANNWGTHKKERLNSILKQSRVIDSNFAHLTEAYVNIDLFSKNKHKSLRLPKAFTSRNMGKNDIWIAATTHLLQLPLISTDRDFEHLDKQFIDFIYINSDKIFH